MWPVRAIKNIKVRAYNAKAERPRAQLSYTTVINKRLLMHPYGPLSGFKKACPYRNLHYRISMQLYSK